MRHYRRAEDPDCQQERLAPGELGLDGVQRDGPERRVRVPRTRPGSRRRSRPRRRRSPPRTCGSPKRCRPRITKVTIPVRTAAGKRAIPKQQVEAEGGAEELGEVGGHRDQLGLDPEPEGRPAREALAADLREIAAGGDPELRRQRLDQHRHQVRGDDHPDRACSRTSSRPRCSSRSCPGRCRRRTRRMPGRGRGGCASCAGIRGARPPRPARCRLRRHLTVSPSRSQSSPGLGVSKLLRDGGRAGCASGSSTSKP